MNDTLIATTKVVAVLLADGWHRIVPGSFGVGPITAHSRELARAKRRRDKGQAP